jgi:methyl-accepting chemotaxis protein
MVVIQLLSSILALLVETGPMSISFSSLRTKAISAVALIVASVLGGTGLTYFSVRQQQVALNDVHAAADTVVGPAIALIRAAKDVQLDVVQVQQFLSDISATRGQGGLNDGLEEAQKSAAKFIQDTSAASGIASDVNRPDIVALLSETKSAFEPYYQTGQRMAAAYIEGGPAGGNLIMPDFDKSSEALQSKMDQLLSMVAVVVDDAAGHLRSKIGLIESRGDRLVRMTALLGALGTLLAAVASMLAIVWVVHPVARMTSAMRRLADGDLAVTVSDQNRRDEIGAMAAAVLVFRTHMATERRLAAEQTEERQRAEAEKHNALLGMADKIETDTTAALHDVDARTTAMATTADEMSASAVRTGNAATGAAAAATQALANAQTVASAAEELSASIREIGVQVAQSTQVVRNAVAAGHKTRKRIETLNEQVAQIGAVADIIGEIAAKTNLLALNATIEAARAGDAGKGFAVVASEVKQLATQTAHSTQEIAQHLGQVRSATGESVDAVVEIENTISEVSTIASTIAAAVEQQQAATAEIARNVAETASATNEMTKRAQDVSIEAEQTGKRAAEVREGAAALDAAVSELRHSVIRVVRTSTSEVNRRLDQRHAVDIACRLSIGGATSMAKMADLSVHGALVRNAPTASVGTRGTLTMDEVDFVLPFSVRAVGDDALHLEFELDDASAARFGSVVERLSARRAA